MWKPTLLFPLSSLPFPIPFPLRDLWLLQHKRQTSLVCEISGNVIVPNMPLVLYHESKYSSGWCDSVDWVPAYEPKGCQFDSQSGHVPGYRTGPWLGGIWEATTYWCFSPSLSLSLPLSLKIKQIKSFLKKQKNKSLPQLQYFLALFQFSPLLLQPPTNSQGTVLRKRKPVLPVRLLVSMRKWSYQHSTIFS